MAGVADYGHGNYYYLEKLALLDKVVSDEFHRASQIVAGDMRVNLDLSNEVSVVDASGYPYHMEGSRVIVEPGHLYSGQKKSFFITLQVPTHSLFMRPLGRVELTWQGQDRFYRTDLLGADVAIACLPTDKKSDVLGSMDKKVYEKAWTENNYGKFLKESAAKVSEGDQMGALKSIQNYRNELQKVYESAPSPAIKQKIEDLKPQEAEVRGAFSSSDAVTATKKLGKDYQYEGIQKQRSAP